ncbi:MAG TPA: hypothetical protein VMY77_00345 [Chitinophagaceae bacterium]|nr:hypothetical protein [Chitinophagaceae bacterium]
MNETDILSDIADSLLDKPITFTVDIVSRTWFDNLLIKWKLKKSKREFKIAGATLGTMIKISKELLAIDLTGFDRKNILDSNYKLAEDHAERMAKIIAIAVVNNKADPSPGLINFFLNNLTVKELKVMFNTVLAKIDYVNFLTTIASAKQIDILTNRTANVKSANGIGVSLEAKENIAFGIQSEEL